MNLQKMTQLHKIIFDNEFPTESVLVHKIPFNFIFSDRILPTDLQNRVTFFDNVIKCQKIPQKFISILPHVIFQEISIKYHNFQIRVGESLLNNLNDFVNTAESQGLWQVYKNGNPRWIINVENDTLNRFQKQWIILNANQDNANKGKMISNIFEALQPWLDKELYAKIKEEEEEFSSVRKNVFYDKNAEDVRLRAKAKEIAEERKNLKQNSLNDDNDDNDDNVDDNDDDLDIITLGDE